MLVDRHLQPGTFQATVEAESLVSGVNLVHLQVDGQPIDTWRMVPMK